jgi:hypothetical protein
MAFQNQKDGILKFYETTSNVVDQHKCTFQQLVTKLNEKVGLTQTLTNDLDTFMEHSFPEFTSFKQFVQSQPLEDSHISFVYDINKGEYTDSLNLPHKNCIIKHSFVCDLIGNQNCGYLNSNSTVIAIPDPKTQKPFNSDTFKTRTHPPSCKYVLEFNDKFRKTCNCNQRNGCGCGITIGNQPQTYEKKESYQFEMWVDDYFNIYIPSIKTYLVFNYSKFPLFSFFINEDKLNLYHNYFKGGKRPLLFNEYCTSDLETFNLLKDFNSRAGNYSTSQDTRDLYKTLFPNVLEFYQYYNKQAHFEQYQNLSEKLEQLNPSMATHNSGITHESNSMSDESKLFAQSLRIRELDIITQKQTEEIECLRTERVQYIKTEQETSVKLSEFEKLLEELNTQLHDEIDKTGNLQKDIISLKTSNMELGTLKIQYRSLEDKLGNTKTQLVEAKDALSKAKVINNTLVDKQAETQQKLTAERATNTQNVIVIKELKLKIEEEKTALLRLETEILSEKEQHQLSKDKIDELIKSASNTKQPDDDQYQEILLSQLKDKNEEIKQTKQANKTLAKKLEEGTKQFELLKSQVSALIHK